MASQPQFHNIMFRLQPQFKIMHPPLACTKIKYKYNQAAPKIFGGLGEL